MSLIATLEATLAQVAAPFVKRLGLSVLAADTTSVTLAMPLSAEIVHSGGVLCGQAMLAAADTAMILAVTAALGEFRPMTTVQLQTSFVRPVPGSAPAVTVHCALLRLGRSLAFGEIRISGPNGTLAAHATTTYALL